MDELQAWAASLPPHEEIAPMDNIDTSTTLLPCPFCGGDDLYFPHGTDPAVIECSGCGARSGVPDDQTEVEATAKWNRRALIPALSAERDDLRAKLDAAVDALWNVDGLDPEGMIDGCSPLAIKALVLRMGEIARATIAKIKGEDK